MIGKNNPLNVRYSSKNNWLGQTGQTRGFCNFSYLSYGIRACLYLLIVSYPSRGIRSLRDIINAYAPPSENNTDNYLSFVSDFTGFSPDFKPIELIHFVKITEAMSIMEGNQIEIPYTMCLYFERIFTKYIKKLK